VTVPTGHQCIECGARVESRTVDWADDDGQRMVVEDRPLFCDGCTTGSTSNGFTVRGGRMIRVEGVRKA
jgi:hypothetical protein